MYSSIVQGPTVVSGSGSEYQVSGALLLAHCGIRTMVISVAGIRWKCVES